MFVRLPDVPSDVTSKDILDRFFTVLHAEFGTDSDGHRRTKRQDRSLQVSFPEYDLYVDAVPRVRTGTERLGRSLRRVTWTRGCAPIPRH